MYKFVIFAILILSSRLSWSSSATPTGIILDTPWKEKLNEFAVANVIHPSWGYSHAERNFHNTKWIAEKEGFKIDEDVLLAAAFLHDVGGLSKYEKEGVDHGVRSAEVGIPLLRTWGFPEEKLGLVEELIIGHIYYGPAPQHPWSKAFRDADMLDFLGMMGISRILAATNELGSYPTIKNSVNSLNKLMSKIENEFSYASSKSEGDRRLKESRSILKKLEAYSFKGNAY